MLLELARREKQSKLKPEEDLDIFIKAMSLDGKDASLLVDYILKVLHKFPSVFALYVASGLPELKWKVSRTLW